LMFLPRRWRLFAAWTTLLTQALIIATSNHNFFNLLTMALCLFLLDDRALPRWWWLTGPRAKRTEGTPIPVAGPAVSLASLVSALVIVPVSLGLIWEMLSGRPAPAALAEVTPYVRSFGVAHRYHVFPTMKTERIEIEVEGSHDGRHWLPYRFRYKPQAVEQRPAFIIPHQPRLDWMMWFIPLGMAMNQIWFEAFMERLLDNAPGVTALLAENPFADTPPRYIQASAYLYRFTTPAERAQSGDWWVRESLGPLFPFPRQR
ncbi:MAG: lipase maturation factor family protein, partial [Pseudomonadota bacterium]